MKSSKTVILAVVSFIFSVGILAQSRVEVTKTQNFRQEVKPQLVDNYMYSSYYTNAKNVYNLKGFKLSSSSQVIDFKVNPAGFSYAVLSGNKSKALITIYDIVETNKVLYKFKDITNATALCYSADSRNLIVAIPDQGLSFFETKGYTQVNQIGIPGTVSAMTASPNGYFIAATGIDHQVHIINLQRNSIRLSIPVSGTPLCVRFSEDAFRLGILTSDKLSVYNTIDFNEEASFGNLISATSFDFHPEGKFVTIGTDGKELAFFNLVDSSDKASLVDPQGVGNVRYLKDAKENTYLSYTTPSSIMYKMIRGLAPNYTKMMRDELNARMMEWCKRLPGETDEEFNQRVNEESMACQKKLFANEISTRLAGDMMANVTLSLGNYNPETNILYLKIDNMGLIYIKVPQSELASFDNPANLEFRDVQYGLTKDDRFEVIYAKVFNKVTGKEYIFDNLERQSLDFLSTDDSFVPLELVQMAGKEDLVLQGVATGIVSQARQKNLISEHTNISVNAVVVPDYDANGKRINNYKVDFN